jgi:hypothetical protein
MLRRPLTEEERSGDFRESLAAGVALVALNASLGTACFDNVEAFGNSTWSHLSKNH